MKKIILDGNYKIKTIKRKYSGSTARYKQIIKYRNIDVGNNCKIEEGIIFEHYDKYFKGEQYQKAQEHLWGYKYLSLINNSTKKDICWIQKYKSNETWVLRSYYFPRICMAGAKEIILNEFLKFLLEKYGIDLTIINSEILA